MPSGLYFYNIPCTGLIPRRNGIKRRNKNNRFLFMGRAVPRLNLGRMQTPRHEKEAKTVPWQKHLEHCCSDVPPSLMKRVTQTFNINVNYITLRGWGAREGVRDKMRSIFDPPTLRGVI